MLLESITFTSKTDTEKKHNCCHFCCFCNFTQQKRAHGLTVKFWPPKFARGVSQVGGGGQLGFLELSFSSTCAFLSVFRKFLKFTFGRVNVENWRMCAVILMELATNLLSHPMCVRTSNLKTYTLTEYCIDYENSPFWYGAKLLVTKSLWEINACFAKQKETAPAYIKKTYVFYKLLQSSLSCSYLSRCL